MDYHAGNELFQLCCYRNPFLAISFLNNLHLHYDPITISNIVNYVNNRKRKLTPLIAACEFSAPEVVEKLLYYGANVHHTDENRCSAVYATLRRAIDQKRVLSSDISSKFQFKLTKQTVQSILDLLFSYGATLVPMESLHHSNDANDDILSILRIAGPFTDSNRSYMLFTHIIPNVVESNYIDPNIEIDGHSLLCIAIQYNSFALVQSILDAGGDIYWCNTADGRSLLHYAVARSDNVPMIDILLRRVGPVEARQEYLSWRDKRGQTALHIAVQQRVKTNAQCLIEVHHADIHAEDDCGRSILMYAVSASVGYILEEDVQKAIDNFHSQLEEPSRSTSSLTLHYLLYHSSFSESLIQHHDQWGRSVLFMALWKYAMTTFEHILLLPARYLNEDDSYHHIVLNTFVPRVQYALWKDPAQWISAQYRSSVEADIDINYLSTNSSATMVADAWYYIIRELLHAFSTEYTTDAHELIVELENHSRNIDWRRDHNSTNFLLENPCVIEALLHHHHHHRRLGSKSQRNNRHGQYRIHLDWLPAELQHLHRQHRQRDHQQQRLFLRFPSFHAHENEEDREGTKNIECCHVM